LLTPRSSRLKNKDKVLVNKRVTRIKHGLNSVSVICADGSEFVGDIVVGADGIHSRVRQEMQRLSDEETPGLMDRDKNCITAEYNCIFGTSSPTSALPPGHAHVSSDIDHSSLLFIGKDALPQWFFVSKMDKKYHGSSIPRFTQKQIEEQIQQHEDFKFADKISFKDLLKTTRSKSYLALEEANHEHWTWGRIVCAGDSIHKMTPNVGRPPYFFSRVIFNSGYRLVKEEIRPSRVRPS
jgi:FAD dependent monooxygenase